MGSRVSLSVGSAMPSFPPLPPGPQAAGRTLAAVSPLHSPPDRLQGAGLPPLQRQEPAEGLWLRAPPLAAVPPSGRLPDALFSAVLYFSMIGVSRRDCSAQKTAGYALPRLLRLPDLQKLQRA